MYLVIDGTFSVLSLISYGAVISDSKGIIIVANIRHMKLRMSASFSASLDVMLINSSVPDENPHRNGKNLQTACRKRLRPRILLLHSNNATNCSTMQFKQVSENAC